MRPMIVLALTLLAAGCAGKHELANCTGPLVALNAAHWQPTQPELDAIAQVAK